MREGVGVESSLRWVAGRFAERAVEDFFASSARREFVIDAAMAVEFAAKGVVARHDAPALYDVKDARPLSNDELLVLRPSHYPDRERPNAERWAAAMTGLLDLETIAGRDAAKRAAKLAQVHNQTTVDVAAANRLFDARNRAAHLGDIDESQMDRYATDFLATFTALSTTLHAGGVMLFGNLAAIADPKHMKVDRSPKVDTRVQVVLARRRSQVGVVTPARRSTLQVAGDTTRCPACNQRAHITVQQMHALPAHRLSRGEVGHSTDTLDCLYCGLTLYGSSQITYAQRVFPGPNDMHEDVLGEYS